MSDVPLRIALQGELELRKSVLGRFQGGGAMAAEVVLGLLEFSAGLP